MFTLKCVFVSVSYLCGVVAFFPLCHVDTKENGIESDGNLFLFLIRRNDSSGSSQSVFEPLLANGAPSQLVPK